MGTEHGRSRLYEEPTRVVIDLPMTRGLPTFCTVAEVYLIEGRKAQATWASTNRIAAFGERNSSVDVSRPRRQV